MLRTNHWRTKDEYYTLTSLRVAVSCSRAHTVAVDAGSLYEVVALAVVEFRADSLSEIPGAMTEFTISIARPCIEHRIRLGQVTTWAGARETDRLERLKDYALSDYSKNYDAFAALVFS